jgi:pilus assembly protein CpaB
MYRIVSVAPTSGAEQKHSFVVVARHAIPMGARLTSDDVKLVAWPRENPVEGAFSSVDQINGRALTASVFANEPIVERRVAPVNAGAGLPPVIEPGMRAISVKVDEVVGVAGFVVPGTRVDVLVTVRPNPQQDEMARVVVSNATVLTAGTRYDQEEANSGKAIRSSVVTLMVTPEDAERVALAQSRGSIMLTLRNPLDTMPTSSQGVHLANLVGTSTPVRLPVRPAPVRRPLPVKPVAVIEAPKPYTVDTIRAAKRTAEVVK